MSDYSKEDRLLIAKYHLYLFTSNNIVQPAYDMGYRAASGHLPTIIKNAEVLEHLVERNISLILRIAREVNDFMEQKPLIGLIVHYVDDNGECCAAIILAVGETVTLKIFNQMGTDYIGRKVQYSEEKEVSTWHWPERV